MGGPPIGAPEAAGAARSPAPVGSFIAPAVPVLRAAAGAGAPPCGRSPYCEISVISVAADKATVKIDANRGRILCKL